MNVRDHIERIKTKPEHVRRRIAFGTSIGITGVVATVWFFTLLFGGTLSLDISPTILNTDGTIAQSPDTSTANPGNTNSVASSNSNFSQLLGAVGVSTAKPAPAALQVEDQAPAPATTTPQPTVIPF